MGLNQREKADLLDLAAGAGNPRAKEGAERLVAESPQAAAFYQEAVRLARHLEHDPNEEEDLPADALGSDAGDASALSMEEARTKADVIFARWQNRRPAGLIRVAGGLAAVLALLIGAVWVIQQTGTSRAPTHGQVIYHYLRAYNLADTAEVRREKIAGPIEVVTGEEIALITDQESIDITVRKMSSVTWFPSRRHLEIGTGTLFCEARESVSLQGGTFLAELDEGEILWRQSDNLTRVNVLKGNLRLSHGGRSYLISGGYAAVFTADDAEPIIVEDHISRPQWASHFKSMDWLGK
jgi:hypothetical protein